MPGLVRQPWYDPRHPIQSNQVLPDLQGRSTGGVNWRMILQFTPPVDRPCRSGRTWFDWIGCRGSYQGCRTRPGMSVSVRLPDKGEYHHISILQPVAANAEGQR